MKRKTYWMDSAIYKRLMEILEVYWLENEDEETVEIDLYFRKANGEEQCKKLRWRNPNL